MLAPYPAMSVNHSLLPISDSELASLLADPASVRALVEKRDADVCRLWKEGLAIVALTATGEDDPLAFLQSGAPDAVSGRVGDVDMGYGPASYYKNRFIAGVASRLRPLTVGAFADRIDLDWLDENNIYPGCWRNHPDANRKMLIDRFAAYRGCVLSASDAGMHLLVWSH
jgi:hypothetical protein